MAGSINKVILLRLSRSGNLSGWKKMLIFVNKKAKDKVTNEKKKKLNGIKL